MVVAPGAYLVTVDMLVNQPLMIVDMDMHLRPGGAPDSPGADPKKEETNKKLGPCRPKIDVDQGPKNEAKAAEKENSNAMPEAPDGTGPSCPTRILDRHRRQCGQVVRSRERVKNSGGQPSQ